MRIPAKDNLCIDDGNAHAPGQADVHIVTCNRDNNNQQWSLLETSTGSQIIATRKNNLCLDSNGLTSGSVFHLWTCNASNPNQQFELVAGS